MCAHAGRRSSRGGSALGAVALAALALSGAGCAKSGPAPPTRVTWIVGAPLPALDPAGPPNVVRWSLERLLTRGLVDEDTSGAIVPAAAERWELSPDGLTLTFYLRPGLKFTDGSPCTSEDFRRALLQGLGRTDHATRAWLLAAVRGVSRVRAGRPLPEIGISTPDPHTLRLVLSHPDSLLPAKLALPGVSAPLRAPAGGGWEHAVGIGPYRVLPAGQPARLTLVRAAPDSGALAYGGPDTVHVRFLVGAGRMRSALRVGGADLAWPLPAGVRDEPPPSGYDLRVRRATPRRRLLLVLRADVPPTTRLEARRALVHGLNREDLLRALGGGGRDLAEWMAGAGPFEFPRLDPVDVRAWLARGNLGNSIHVRMTYPADGPPAEIARLLQGQWALLGLSVDLEPLRGHALERALLLGQAQLALADPPRLLRDPSADLATMVMPLRGPAVGSVRTGWRTREFDPWILPGRARTPLDPVRAQRRMEQATIVLPIAHLPWMWVVRRGSVHPAFHPHFGPEWAFRNVRSGAAR